MRLQRQRVLTTIGVLGLIWAASVASAATTLDTTISTNTRLTVDGSPYILQGTTTVPAGVRLVCASGSIVKAPPGAELLVYGTLIANEATFRATARPTSPADHWGGIRILGPDASGTIIRHCTILHAGHNGTPALSFDGQTSGGPLAGSNVVNQSAGDGILCRNGSPVFSSNRILNCNGAAVRAEANGFPTFSDNPTTRTGNLINGTVIDWDSTPHGTFRLTKAGGPYRIRGMLSIPRDGELRVEAGTRLLFADKNAGMIIRGELDVNGVANDRVWFKSENPAFGWNGLEFRDNESSASRLEYTTIENAGFGNLQAAVLVRGSRDTWPQPRFHHCNIDDSASDGIASQGARPRLGWCKIRNCRGRAIINTFGGYANFVNNRNQATGNDVDAVVFDAAGHALIFDQEWKEAGTGFPYHILGSVSTEASREDPGTASELDIGPGAHLMMGPGVYLTANHGVIRAIGKSNASKHITIERLDPASAWGGIFVTGRALPSFFRWCDISGGGSGGASHITVTSSGGTTSVAGADLGLTEPPDVLAATGVKIEDSTFTDGAGHGIYSHGPFLWVLRTVITGHKLSGIASFGTTGLVVRNSDIYKNDFYGIYHQGGGMWLADGNSFVQNDPFNVANITPHTVAAARNYWGSTDIGDVRDSIFDGRDSPGLGQLRLAPILLAAPRALIGVTAAPAIADAALVIPSAVAQESGSGIVQVSYVLTTGADVSAEVVNIAGRPIRRLTSESPADAGTNTLLWDTRSDSGVSVPNGRYLIRLRASSPSGELAQAIAPVTVTGR